MMGRVPEFLACAGALWLAAAPAAADWLVTRDGSRIETDGPWKVEGRQVVFTLPAGTLSALRLDDVDLEASERATAASRAEKPRPAQAPKRRPVLVLTNDDIPRASRDESRSMTEEAETQASGSDDEDEGLEQSSSRQQVPESAVELSTWSAKPSEEVDGLEIVGVVRNTGTDIAANVTLGVTVVDEDGATLFETNAFLRSAGIPPGRSTTFRALLPGIAHLAADPVFDVRALQVTGEAALPRPKEEEGEDEGATRESTASGTTRLDS